VIIVVAGKDQELYEAADQLANELTTAGIEVVVDDRNVSPGVKFADSELIGFPTVVIVGRGLKDGVVEVRDRRLGTAQSVPLAEAMTAVLAMV
jgi:prolyl-tRNA synthetase